MRDQASPRIGEGVKSKSKGTETMTTSIFFWKKKKHEPRFKIGKSRLTNEEFDFQYVQRALDLENKRKGGKDYVS
jgi:hypothetical protein